MIKTIYSTIDNYILWSKWMHENKIKCLRDTGLNIRQFSYEYDFGYLQRYIDNEVIIGNFPGKIVNWLNNCCPLDFMRV